MPNLPKRVIGGLLVMYTFLLHSRTSNIRKSNIDQTSRKSAKENRAIQTSLDIVRGVLPPEADDEAIVVFEESEDGPCLIDLIYKSGRCTKRKTSLVCIFPNVIIKQDESQQMYENEKSVLNRLPDDTLYFPRLYAHDDRCRTLLIENVARKTKDDLALDLNLTDIRTVNETIVRNKTNPCLIDLIFTPDSCGKRPSLSTVCVFPYTIIKTDAIKYAKEKNFHRLLNDTRYFPKLQGYNNRCRTLLIENVHAPNDIVPSRNIWSEKRSYYEAFYNRLFKIFQAHQIVPIDLNYCCNTIVNGTQIRIIDFGKYRIEENFAQWRQDTNEIRLELLSGMKREMEKGRSLGWY